MIDTGLEYRPGDPVRVRVVRRAQRISVTDDGAAIEKAGRPPRWREAADRLDCELVVNISQQGVVSLPVVVVGPGTEKIVRRIAQASLGFYQELLDVEDLWAAHVPHGVGFAWSRDSSSREGTPDRSWRFTEVIPTPLRG